jgi:hypothetical protein
MGAQSGSALRAEITLVRSGTGDGQSLVAAFREAVLLLPQTADGSVAAGDYGGVRWLYASRPRRNWPRGWWRAMAMRRPSSRT